MNYAVVDTGSNTIRMSIYSYENNSLKEIFTEAVFANLAVFIANDSLTDEGIEICSNAILKHIKTAKEYDAQFYVFATAAIRNAKNCDEIVEKVEKRTGIKMHVLSGEEEGELSFLGAFDDFPVSCGIMADVGGGSSEIIAFSNGQIVSALSVPIGSLKAYKSFVSGEIPTYDEVDKIKKEIKKYLQSNDGFKNIKEEALCLVGGGAMASRKLANFFLKKEEFDIKTANKLLDIFVMTPDILQVLEKLIPKRKFTISTGLAIYSAIGEYFYSDKIYISDKGIKEGYAKKYIVH